MQDVALRLAKRLFDRPLIQNSFRGAFVEELIAPLLAGHGWRHCGDDWSSWDFEHESGARLELKQSALVQSWEDNPEAPERHPSFNIEEKNGYWTDGVFTEQIGRPAHLYIFAWHGVAERALADHRRLEQWEFFVIDSRALPQQQRTIRLSVLQRLGATAASGIELAEEVEALRAKLT